MRIKGQLLDTEKNIMISNPAKGSYMMWYDIQEEENEATNVLEYSYMEHRFDSKPSLNDIKKVIIDYYNGECDKEILSGLQYENYLVWLSQENQINYQRQYVLAVNNGSNLPIVVKVGDDDSPQNISFTTVEDFEDFFNEVNNHIEDTLSKYRTIKDNIDWTKYEI